MKKNQALAATLVGVSTLAGCGGGLPSCDDFSVEDMVKAIMIKRNEAAEGEACIYNRVFKLVRPGPDCPSDMTPVSDMKPSFLDYTVRSEAEAADGRSVTCGISATMGFQSEQAKFESKGVPRVFSITIFQKSLDGSQAYEYRVQ